VIIAAFAIGVGGLIAFACVELFVVKEPLLQLRLFKIRNFLTASLVGYVTVLALFGAEFLMPIYLQALRGRTAFETGLILLSLAVSSGIMTPLAGRIYDRIGPRALVVTGFTILSINTWQLAQIQATTPITWIMFLLALRGIALGLTVQTTFTTALASVPRNLLPRGSSLANSTRFVIQSVGVAVLATVVASALTPDVRQAQAAAQESGQAANQPFGLCETPGVAPENNLPPAAVAQLQNPSQGTDPAQIKATIRAGIERACQ
jgi:DHA2 family multidrug resistance protein